VSYYISFAAIPIAVGIVFPSTMEEVDTESYHPQCCDQFNIDTT
jgi:hypothetical protein